MATGAHQTKIKAQYQTFQTRYSSFGTRSCGDNDLKLWFRFLNLQKYPGQLGLTALSLYLEDSALLAQGRTV